MHQLKRTLRIPLSLEKTWEFFSAPKNLKVITPDYMGFEIISEEDQGAMYPGMIICYKVSPFPGVKMNWMTEITHVRDQEFFVDEQRLGPYKIWHHQHHFKEIEGGVEMTDIIDYVLPMGPVGKLMEPILVRKRLAAIFDYREEKIRALFGPLES